VAQERDSGEFCAIQCKFYAPDHYLQKADIDSFFTASGKQPFTTRIIISTTDKWGTNAEAALEHQQIPVARVGLAEIAQAPINWDLAWPSVDIELELRRTPKKELRLHQRTAVDKVLAGLATLDRGKLIMACGTGKTFTSLKIAERIAACCPRRCGSGPPTASSTCAASLCARTRRSAGEQEARTSAPTTSRCLPPPTPPSLSKPSRT
jgi:predicted helicase